MTMDEQRHMMQHPDSPTWCVWCGTFDVYAGEACPADRTGGPRYDFGVRANAERQAAAMFGCGRPASAG